MNKELLIDEKFICNLKKGDVKSYRQLYDNFASPMKLVCMRYVKIEADAEDVFQEGFVKIYSNIQQLKNAKSFVGWMKRVFINTSLDQLKKRQEMVGYNIDELSEGRFIDVETDEFNIGEIEFNGKLETLDFEVIRKVDFSQEDMLNALATLPDHFMIVFQLHVIDHFKHKEIAEMLDINEKTSKTRLLRARGLLKLELQRMAHNIIANG